MTTCVLGPLLGLSIALVCVASMPHQYLATISVALPAGARVHAPAHSKLTPRAQLYGVLGPGQTPATLAFSGAAGTSARAVTLVLAQERRWQSHTPPSLQLPPAATTVTIEHSPRPVRDALLGLIAGLLVALALTTSGRRPWVQAA